jgi:hypothetical protein
MEFSMGDTFVFDDKIVTVMGFTVAEAEMDYIVVHCFVVEQDAKINNHCIEVEQTLESFILFVNQTTVYQQHYSEIKDFPLSKYRTKMKYYAYGLDSGSTRTVLKRVLFEPPPSADPPPKKPKLGAPPPKKPAAAAAAAAAKGPPKIQPLPKNLKGSKQAKSVEDDIIPPEPPIINVVIHHPPAPSRPSPVPEKSSDMSLMELSVGYTERVTNLNNKTNQLVHDRQCEILKISNDAILKTLALTIPAASHNNSVAKSESSTSSEKVPPLAGSVMVKHSLPACMNIIKSNLAEYSIETTGLRPKDIFLEMLNVLELTESGVALGCGQDNLHLKMNYIISEFGLDDKSI